MSYARSLRAPTCYLGFTVTAHDYRNASAIASANAEMIREYGDRYLATEPTTAARLYRESATLFQFAGTCLISAGCADYSGYNPECEPLLAEAARLVGLACELD